MGMGKPIPLADKQKSFKKSLKAKRTKEKLAIEAEIINNPDVMSGLTTKQTAYALLRKNGVKPAQAANALDYKMGTAYNIASKMTIKAYWSLGYIFLETT